jgi:hypothetical protein
LQRLPVVDDRQTLLPGRIAKRVGGQGLVDLSVPIRKVEAVVVALVVRERVRELGRGPVREEARLAGTGAIVGSKLWNSAKTGQTPGQP